MVKLKRTYESCFESIPCFESKQDEERLKAYLGADLFNQYMYVRKKLPNLSNQFKDFTKVNFDTGNKDNDNEIKKDLVNSYNRLIKYLPKDKQSLYKPLEGVNPDSIDESGLEEILNAYREARDIVFKDQARFRDFGQLSKIPVADIQNLVDSFSTNRAKKQQYKVDGADKLYEDSDWVVYRITTYPAAQLYGSNTKWCITGRFPEHEGRGETYFNDYIRDNNLDGGYYFYLSKKDPSEKYCVLQRKDKAIHSIWDARDTLRGSSYDELGVDLPEVKEINLSKYTIDGFIKEIRKNKVDKVKEYIDNGLDLNSKGAYGKTPLYWASFGGHKDIVELLLSNGADPDIKDEYDITPLYLASRNGRKDIVELLLKHGADLNIKDEYGITPLHLASDKVYKDIVELLLKYGADPNVENNGGNTPLYVASFDGHKDIVELLLKHGADPNIKNNGSQTALHVASDKGYKDIVDLLKKYGAKE